VLGLKNAGLNCVPTLAAEIAVADKYEEKMDGEKTMIVHLCLKPTRECSCAPVR
jgi:hypothetical protein